MAPPRVIQRSVASQTFTPACDPVIVEQIAALKREAAKMTESLAEARAETSEAREALEAARVSAAEDLTGARAETAAAEKAMAEALVREAEAASGLKSEVSQRVEKMEALVEALEHTEGSLKAAKLDLSILERKHSRAVESMVEYRYCGPSWIFVLGF